MSPDDQKRILAELFDRIKEEMLGEIDGGSVPEEWDGIELRQWFAERAWRERVFIYAPKGRFHPTSKRVTQYREAVLVNNL